MTSTEFFEQAEAHLALAERADAAGDDTTADREYMLHHVNIENALAAIAIE